MFATPLFLIAAAAGAVIPLVLHMFQHSRTVETPFPTLRFLKMAEQKASRRIKMENWLLWLLRTLLLVILGFAFAMPMIRTDRMAWLGNRPRDIAIVIDASYSMGYSMGRETVWQRAIKEATAIVKGLGPNDRFCLYLARDTAEPIIAEPVAGVEQGVSKLKALQLKHTASQLAPALTAANDALQKQKSGGREREIYLITDNQALPWNRFGNKAAAKEDHNKHTNTTETKATNAEWDPATLDKQTTLFVALLGATAPENVSPIEAQVQPALMFAGTSGKASLRLAHSGSAQDTTVTLFIDDEEIGRRSVVAGAASAADLTFTIPPLQVGVHTARVETPADNLALDNTFYFLLRVKEDLPSLCIGAKADTFFIRAALNATLPDGNGINTEWITPDKIADYTLSEYACIFLCNALPIPGQSLTAIDKYIKQGGLLVLFPGSDATIADYNAWQSLPAPPSRVNIVPNNDRQRLLTWDAPNHPMLKPIQEARVAPTITLRRSLIWDKPNAQTTVMATCGEGQPFLLDREYGRGHVLMFAVPADRSWSSLPLSPFYLPLVHQAVTYGAGLGATTPFLWSTDLLSLQEHLPEATHDTVLYDPKQETVSIRSAVENGQTFLHAENLTFPGIYTMSGPSIDNTVPALAINIPRHESMLTPINTENITKLLGTDNVQIAYNRNELQQQIKDHRIGRTFGEQLLWIVLILAVLEFFYANRLLKAQPNLSSQMHMDASGKVSATGLHAGLKQKGGSANP